MKPKWIVQTNILGDDTRDLIAEIKRQYMVVSPSEYHIGKPIDLLGCDEFDCVICYGSVDFVIEVNNCTQFCPGAYCNFYNMRCSTYYSYLGNYLLNRQYAMMPIGDLVNKFEYLTTLNNDKSIFIRPDSGVKSFTGMVVYGSERHKIQSLADTIGVETLVVVTSRKDIGSEYRFVICDNQVITGCQYLPIESSEYPPICFRLAQRIAMDSWQPDRCYTVDIVESNGDAYLIEINSFSCAAFYKCDLRCIVKSVSEVAEDEWKKI